MGRFGRIVLSAGALVMICGLLGFVFTIHQRSTVVTPWQLLPSLFVAGIGMGCVVSGVFPFVLASVPLDKAGSASGLINAMNQAGGAIGVAAFGTIFFGTFAVRASSGLLRPLAYQDAMVTTQSALMAALGVVFAVTWFLPARLPKGPPRPTRPESTATLDEILGQTRLHDAASESGEASATTFRTESGR